MTSVPEEEKSLDIFVDENNNLAIFSIILNPEFPFDFPVTFTPPDDMPDIPPWFYAKKPLELAFPYTVDDLAKAIEQGIANWNKGVPRKAKRPTIEEYYYKCGGYRKSSFRKRMLTVLISSSKVDISLFMPTKTPEVYMGLDDRILPASSTWAEIASAAMELIEADYTKLHRYNTFKRRLNV